MTPMFLIAAAALAFAPPPLGVDLEQEDTLTVEDLGPVLEDGLWTPSTSYNLLLDAFLADAKRVDEESPAQRNAVAQKYGLAPATFEEVLALLRDADSQIYDHGRFPALRERALKLLRTKTRSTLTLSLAAAMISGGGDGCENRDAELLLGHASDDRDLWAIATSCLSSAGFARALDRATSARPALYFVAMSWTSGEAAAQLAAADVMLQPEFLLQVEEGQRENVHADVAGLKLATLLGLGLTGEALAFGDSLPAPVLAGALFGRREKARTVIGGFARDVDGDRERLAGNYAAALAVSGRAAEARAMLDRIAPAAALRQVAGCFRKPAEACAMEENRAITLGVLVVDQLLDRPDEDPFWLIESLALEHSPLGGAAVEALCRLMKTAEERALCDAARQDVDELRRRGADGADDQALWGALARAGGARFEAARASYAAKLPPPTPEADTPGPVRASVDPAPVPFRELPLPQGLGAPREQNTSAGKGFAALPEGYSPVRFEKSGARAVAISLSQRFDPNGEVTAGGYWLHLSGDGGRTWQAPLYTGLAEHFPYVVPRRSRLPMLAGDRIHLEVEEVLIDTASIFYPPIGTRLRRKRQGIYLDIPIAELRRDGDSDGLSDVAARHLLLDAPAGSPPTPFVAGARSDCAAPGGEALARNALLRLLVGTEASA